MSSNGTKKLSDRLQVIADFVEPGSNVADVGTDHGFLPYYLWEKEICPKVILCDVKKGPLSKAKANLAQLAPGEEFDLRLGSGFEPFTPKEADTAVIAGMGGYVIMSILAADREKTRKFKRIIIQPRNASDKLRKFLWEEGLPITQEKLVREGRYICEVFVVEPAGEWTYSLERNVDCQVSPLLFRTQDPLLGEFIDGKMMTLAKIYRGIKRRAMISRHMMTSELTEELTALDELRKGVK